MKEPAILFIESNTSGTGWMFLQASKRLGFRPILLNVNPSKYEFESEDLYLSVTCETSSLEDILRTCQRLSKHFKIEAVWSSSEYFIATSAVVAETLDLPGPNSSAVARCRSKNAQRSMTAPLSNDAPRSLLATTPKSIQAAALDIGLPVVLKPVFGSGSSGVRFCETYDEAGRAAEEIYNDFLQQTHDPALLVEEYIDGAEYSVEIFDGRSVGVTRKHLGPLPFFVEVGHDFPMQGDPKIATVLTEFAERVANALGITWGPVHIELKITDGNPVLVEANPRLAGGFIPVLIRHAFGVDLIEATLRRALGQEVSFEAKKACSASIRFLMCNQVGDGLSENLISNLRHQRHVAEIRLYSKAGPPGEVVSGDFRDRIGHVMTVGRDIQEATSVADEIAQVLQGNFEGVSNA